mgnify:CR=1 FL=1
MDVFLWTLELSGLSIAVLGLGLERCRRCRRR